MNNKVLKTQIFQAIGHASMCWSPAPKGVFDTTEALKVGNKLYKDILKFQRKAKPNANKRKTK